MIKNGDIGYYLTAVVAIISLLCSTSTGEKPKYKCKTCDGIVENFRKVKMTLYSATKKTFVI